MHGKTLLKSMTEKGDYVRATSVSTVARCANHSGRRHQLLLADSAAEPYSSHDDLIGKALLILAMAPSGPQANK